MRVCITPFPRRAMLGVALAAGLFALAGAGGPLAATPSRAASACRSDPIVVLSNGVVLDLSVDLADDPADVQQVSYTLHGPHGARIVRVVSTDGPVRYKEQFSFHDDSKPSPTLAPAVDVYRVEAHVATATKHINVQATLIGGYATTLGITPDMVGLTTFVWTAPSDGKAPPPPKGSAKLATLPDTVTAQLAAWAGAAAWVTSATSPTGEAGQTLVAAVSL